MTLLRLYQPAPQSAPLRKPDGCLFPVAEPQGRKVMSVRPLRDAFDLRGADTVQILSPGQRHVEDTELLEQEK